MVRQQKTMVVKLGGVAGVDFESICRDVADLNASSEDRLVLVHGGSAEANTLGESLGHPPRFVTSPSGYSSRYTDRRTLEIFAMAVNGKLNTLLVEQLQSMGVNALGISGLDGGLLTARRKAAIRIVENGRQKILRDDYTGQIKQVKTQLLNTLLEAGCIPVVAPLARSETGEALNVDADRAAASIAAALQAETLMLFTAVPGLMRRFPDENTLIHNLPASQLDEAVGYAQGRMKKKVLGAREAIGGGVRQVIISDGRIAMPISKALAGYGTWIG